MGAFKRELVEQPCTHQELLTLLSYDPETGELRWRAGGRRNRPGALAGHINAKEQRRRVGINKKLYYTSQLIWCMVTGHWPRWPDTYVDHRDTYGPKYGIGDRWDNLRLANPMLNQWNRKRQHNNTSGHPGVSQTDDGAWLAVIKRRYVAHHLGTFGSKEAAIAARKAAEIRMDGDFRAIHP